ncbi:unnamed protein product [Closterium sp. NIES-53]
MEGKGYISVQKIAELRAEHKQIYAALPRLEKLLANQSATAIAAATTVAAAAAAATPTILHATTVAATVDLEAVKPRLPEAFDPTVKRNDVCRFVAELEIYFEAVGCTTPTKDAMHIRLAATLDAAARLAVRNHLPLAKRAHFGQHKTAKALYNAIVARYSSPATAALGRLLLPYLFPELSAFATVKNLITHLCTSDTRHRAALTAEFLDKNPPPMYITLYFIVTRLPDSRRAVKYHFLALDPTDLTVDLFKKHLLGSSPSPLAPSYASAAAIDILGTQDVEAASTLSGKRRSSKGKGGKRGGGGSGGGGGGGGGDGGGVGGGGSSGSGGRSGDFGGGGGGSGGNGGGRGGGTRSGGGGSRSGQGGAVQRGGSGGGQRQQQQRWSETPTPQQLHEWSGADIIRLDYDAILAAMYAFFVNAEDDCYLCVPPDPGIKAAALGATESVLPGTAPAEALHTFTLDSGASHCFFCDSTTLTPLPSHVPVKLADPSGGPILARSSTVLPCLAVLSSSLSSLHLPSFSTNLRAASHSSFPPTTAPLQTLHMDVWGPARVSGQDRERYFLLVVDDYTRYTMVFPLCSKGEVPDVLIPWIRTIGLQLHEWFCQDLPVLRLPSNRGGEFSSDLLRNFCHGEGILQSFTLPNSQQKNAVAERHIGFVMVVARTSMIHAAAPPFCGRLQSATLRISSTSGPMSPCQRPCLHCIGEGRMAMRRCSEAGALVPLSAILTRTSFPPAPFPASSLAFPLTRLAGSFTNPPRAVSCPLRTSHPLPVTEPVEVTVDSGAARGAASGFAELASAEPGGAEPASAEPGGAEPEGAEPGNAESEGADSRGAEPEVAEPGGTDPEGAEPGGAESEGAESGGAEPRGTASAGGPTGALPRLSHRHEPLSPQQLREWFAQRTRLRIGAAGAGGPAAGGIEAGGAGATSRGGARTRGTEAAGAGGVGGAGAGDPGAGGTGAVDPRAGGAGPGGVGAGGTSTRGTVQRRPFFVPPPPSSLPPPYSVLCQPYSPLPAPSRYAEQTDSLTERREPESRPASPVCIVRTGHRVPRPRPPAVPGTHIMALPRAVSPAVPRLLAIVVTDLSFESTAASALVAELVDFAATCRLDYATSGVAESEFDCPPFVGGECALRTDVLEDRQEEFECLAVAVPHLVAMLLAPEGDLDAPNIPTPRSYAEAITVPPPGANIVDGMWIFKVKRPPGTPPFFKARYRDYELLSLDFGIGFLLGSLHEEIWMRRPPGFTGSFPAGTQWSLRRPVYGLRQAPREWHDTLRRTLAALGFAPSSAGPSMFLRTDTLLSPFYVLVYVDDLVFATADTEALALVKSELRSYLGLQITRDRVRRTITLTQSHMVHQVLQRFGFRYSSPLSTPLPTGHSLSNPPSHESIEPSGLYPELVGCLMYLMTCTRPDLAYPLSILARYVALERHRPEHWEAAKRMLRYLCSASGMGLVLGGRGPVVLTGHVDASWSEIYAGAMAAQELRWLTYLLADLGKRPRSPPVLYVDNKARLPCVRSTEWSTGTKHIALCYFLARELE